MTGWLTGATANVLLVYAAKAEGSAMLIGFHLGASVICLLAATIAWRAGQ